VIAEIYKNHRYDILRQRLVPSSEGFESAISSNLGVVDSKGLDLSADYKAKLRQRCLGIIQG
jgi:hypothetical protein